MPYFDIIIGIFLVGMIVNGLRKGFVHEVLGLIGLLGGVLAGIWGAGFISSKAADFLPEFLGKTITVHLLSFTFLLIVFFYITRKIAQFLKSMLENLFLGWLNNLLGGTLAGLKGAVTLSVLFMYIAFLPFGNTLNSLKKDSTLYKPINGLVPILYKYIGKPDKLPEEIRKILDKTTEQIIEDSKDEIRREL